MLKQWLPDLLCLAIYCVPQSHQKSAESRTKIDWKFSFQNACIEIKSTCLRRFYVLIQMIYAGEISTYYHYKHILSIVPTFKYFQYKQCFEGLIEGYFCNKLLEKEEFDVALKS